MNCPYCDADTTGSLPSRTAYGTAVYPCKHCSNFVKGRGDHDIKNITLAVLERADRIISNLNELNNTLYRLVEVYMERRR